MKDTTTTIDNILANLAWNGKYYDSGQEVANAGAVEEAKQAILNWHKDKARSYVPEKKQKTFQGTENLDSIQYAHLSGAWEGFNHCIDQTLKAIEDDKHTKA